MITAVLIVVALYLIAGLLFAIYFAASGVVKLDKAARGTSVFFRSLIVPGALALWPYLLRRLIGGKPGPREERNAHRELVRKAVR
jgi:uncharacterized membrane protein YphA (DoxX/SURF4 family)